MNKKRKEIVRQVWQELNHGATVLEQVLDQETDTMTNWPENLQNTDRYFQCEDAVDDLENASSLLKEALPYLESVVG